MRTFKYLFIWKLENIHENTMEIYLNGKKTIKIAMVLIQIVLEYKVWYSLTKFKQTWGMSRMYSRKRCDVKDAHNSFSSMYVTWYRAMFKVRNLGKIHFCTSKLMHRWTVRGSFMDWQNRTFVND